ncbi:hypothetical protein [Hyphomicrobium facile]|uniref:VWFA domain-containing protein n=1 Tax=Hyphomicrobium facile TaxID=51670 RepID=A0A1I7NDR5_9HYPH|nr:hypothetical protein [Hyphomicrobium facile]SFV32800.1 hypothetical protein SAMN04488557_1729 [Hyphomicrobium facile]
MTETSTTDATGNTTIIMVLDRSGSMSSCREATITAVNKYLKDSKADATLKDADFELVIFDTESIDTIRDGKIVDAPELTAADFVPRSGTPLLDAVGRGIGKIDAKLAASNGEKAILVVVTDGEENQSRKHTYESVEALIADRQEKGWLILFLGAGLASAQQGTRMGIRPANVVNIGLDEVALSETMTAMSASNIRYACSDFQDAKAYARSDKFTSQMRKRMGDASGGKGIVDVDALDHLKKAINRGQPAAAPKPDDAWDERGSGDIWGR